jgi:mannan endo-1,4-beta-mannosidase
VQLADEYGKVPALTETGLTGLTNENWFTTVLLDPIKADPIASRIAYFLVWRNYSIKHHYAPYPGEKAVPDFLKFYNDPITIFEKDLPNMYVMP